MAAAPTQFPTLYVVPSSYKWTREAAMKAAEKGQFIRVSATSLGKRFLSGAKRSWASNDPNLNQTVFSTQYRISGTPDNIRTALKYAGVSDEEINNVLANAITRDNYQTTMKNAYDQEISGYQNIKGNKPMTQGYELSQIIWFAQNLKKAQVVTKTGEQRGAVGSKGSRGGQSIAEKIRNLGPDRVIDVSNMDTNTGKSYTTIARPKSNKGGKIGTDRIPIVSNNINNYIRALQLAYGPGAEQQYAADIDLVRRTIEAGRANPTLAVQPGVPSFAGVPRMASPPRVPGATLAPTPVFSTAVPSVATPPRSLGGSAYPAIPALNDLLTR